MAKEESTQDTTRCVLNFPTNWDIPPVANLEEVPLDVQAEDVLESWALSPPLAQERDAPPFPPVVEAPSVLLLGDLDARYWT